jgi:protein TonB
MISLPLLRRADNHRLLTGWGAAALFHLFILFAVGVGVSPFAPQTLEVTLVTLAASELPWQSRAMAPIAQHGGGEGVKIRSQEMHSAGLLPQHGLPNVAGAASAAPPGADSAAAKQAQGTSSSSERLISATASDWQHGGNEAAPRAGAEQQRLLPGREDAGFGPRDASYNQIAHAAGAPDTRLPLAPDAKADPRAAYLDAWRAQVEHTGSANFPWSALILGSSNTLTLEVSVRADGTVTGTRIMRSSGIPALDKAALGILAMSAPFPAFPDTLRQRAGALSFTFDWEFLPGDASRAGATLQVGRN